MSDAEGQDFEESLEIDASDSDVEANEDARPEQLIVSTSDKRGGTANQGPKMTSPYMTKFEKARIIGTRAMQISMNAPITIQANGETDCLAIAERELLQRTVPFIVRRYLPNGQFEDWGVDELIID
eukprot:GHVH01000856.1.p1 GENE.GHVH01000856.1~~GHVH01000856.1.p1  ORF type:complete len:126 (+),score=20.13 GHVH01000856.1:21-398(+)